MDDTTRDAIAADTQNPATTSSASIHLKRIGELLDESLAKDDAMEANVCAVNCALMLMAHRYHRVLADHELASLSDLEFLAPSVEQFLRITKQIERFSQLAAKQNKDAS